LGLRGLPTCGRGLLVPVIPCPPPNKRSPVARLLRRRAWRIHFARPRCWRSRRIFRDTLLHQHLRSHTHRRVRGRRRCPAGNWGRQPVKFLRTGCVVAAPRRLYVDLFLVARWSAAIGGVFWKILFVQRSLSRWRKSRSPLAGRGCALWQLRVTLLLPDRPYSDLR